MGGELPLRLLALRHVARQCHAQPFTAKARFAHGQFERKALSVLAASEAAANAIEHGYGSDGTGVVVVSVRLDDDVVRLTVRDKGGWREPPAPGDRGRGFRLIEAVMDDVSVDRSAGATVVRMTQSTRAGLPA